MDNHDYIIDDTDGYNWVSVPKPLSTYSQEELAEQLMTEKKNTGDEQRIRLTGNIGGILTTDECDTPEEFIEKYQTILNEAGFVKRPVVQEKHKLTVKPLSKASISDYTQEELAHLIMDNKTELEDFQVKYSGYEFSSVGLNTIEDFINKYQDNFYNLRVKDENGNKAKKPQTTKQMVESLEEYKVTVKELSKASISDYTQEELAHLIMDNKSDKEDFQIKYKGYEFSSVGLNTVEEFIDKYQANFYNLRIKDENGNLAKHPETEEETSSIIVSNVDENLMPLLADMIDRKLKNNKDITSIFNGLELNTEQCDSYRSIIEKYAFLIKTTENNRIQTELKDAEVEKGSIIFTIPRGNLYDNTIEKDQEKEEKIKQLNNDFIEIYAKASTLNFENTEEVYTWLNELIPYFNTHALNLNQENNGSPVRKLLLLFESNGYSTDLIIEDNMKDYYRYSITTKLAELEKYNFFISDYKEKRFKGLDSNKIAAMVEIAYLERKIELGKNGLELIEQELENNKVTKELKIAELNRAIDMINYDNTSDINKISYFETAAKTNVEKNAVQAYKELVNTPNVENMEKANLQINKVLEENPNSLLATQLQQSSIFRLGYKRDDVEIKPVKEQLELKEEYLAQIDEIENKEQLQESKLEEQKAEILHLTELIRSKLERIAKRNNLQSVMLEEEAKIESEALVQNDEDDKTFEEIFEESMKEKNKDIDLRLENSINKEGMISKLKKKMSKKSDQDNDVQFIDVDNLVTNDNSNDVIANIEEEPEIQYDLSLEGTNDTLKEFVAVRSFKKINKSLYEKISNIRIKEILKNTLEKMMEAKKAVCVCIGLAALAVITTVSGHAIKQNLNERTQQSSNKTGSIEEEMTIQNSKTDIEKAVDKAIEENELNTSQYSLPGGNSTAPAATEDTINQSLDIISDSSITDAAIGNKNIYASATDALAEENKLDAYKASWEAATTGNYYIENEDGTLKKIDQEEANNYYSNGEKVVQSVENDGTIIGYVSLNEESQGKAL